MLARYHGLNVAQAGGVSAIVLGATGLISLTVGGWLADRLHRAFPRGRLMLGAIAMLVAAPLLWLGLGQAPGQVLALTILLSLGWLLFFLYYVTVYSALQDVIEPRLRATAMAVYFFFMYVLGGALGTLVTGALSDHYAARAMAAASAPAMTDAFRAVGLQTSLSLSVPLAVLLIAVALLFATRSFVADAEKTRLAAQRAAGQ
jgi:MFS family permease